MFVRLYVYKSEEKCTHTASNKATRKTTIIFQHTYKARAKIVPSVPPSAKISKKIKSITSLVLIASRMRSDFHRAKMASHE